MSGERAPHATTGVMDRVFRTRARWRTGLLVSIGVLYVASVPWYRPADPDPPLWFGLPHWVTVAVGCYFAAAVLNAVAWSLTPLSDELEPPPDASNEEAP